MTSRIRRGANFSRSGLVPCAPALRNASKRRDTTSQERGGRVVRRSHRNGRLLSAFATAALLAPASTSAKTYVVHHCVAGRSDVGCMAMTPSIGLRTHLVGPARRSRLQVCPKYQECLRLPRSLHVAVVRYACRRCHGARSCPVEFSRRRRPRVSSGSTFVSTFVQPVASRGSRLRCGTPNPERDRCCLRAVPPQSVHDTSRAPSLPRSPRPANLARAFAANLASCRLGCRPLTNSRQLAGIITELSQSRWRTRLRAVARRSATHRRYVARARQCALLVSAAGDNVGRQGTARDPRHRQHGARTCRRARVTRNRPT